MTMPTEAENTVLIKAEGDIVAVRKAIRSAAQELGFSTTDNTRIVTAASELCRNTYKYAGEGVMRWRALNSGGPVGIEIVFEDCGPGIADIDQAMRPGFTTGKGLGLGLPGAKRLMDEMKVTSEPGRGTTVSVVKWMRKR
jgi:serine/threonine-protein kinase RsbT